MYSSFISCYMANSKLLIDVPVSYNTDINKLESALEKLKTEIANL